ncbi:hypothetical protein EXIGLDRAFT_466010 [Exidia glandulosa HHB12029]|uniref:Uncharacterized protein n=1 Tax=Exidia glandulosa HHB12029 TaxID=1314781 RepID=A0A165AWS6_EXIGL|nr:hypothetical protein EXIGLDRAFT_466010 [Exidia glandulosa HHB12029]
MARRYDCLSLHMSTAEAWCLPGVLDTSAALARRLLFWPCAGPCAGAAAGARAVRASGKAQHACRSAHHGAVAAAAGSREVMLHPPSPPCQRRGPQRTRPACGAADAKPCRALSALLAFSAYLPWWLVTRWGQITHLTPCAAVLQSSAASCCDYP